MRRIPILRWTMPGSPGQKRLAVILGEALDVPVHYDDGLIPCHGHDCQFARNGVCARRKKTNWYAPAHLCTHEDSSPSADELRIYAEAMDRWHAWNRGRPSMHDGAAMKAYPPGPPIPDKPRGGMRLSPVQGGACIAEISDAAINGFPHPLRGTCYTLDKIKGRLAYYPFTPREPIKGIEQPFCVVPHLELIFGMPLYLPGVEEVVMDDGEILQFPRKVS